MNDHHLIPTSLGDEAPPAPALHTVHVEADGRRVDGLGCGDSAYIPDVFSAEETEAMLQRLLPGGEVTYQQWYHMPDRKHPDRPLRPLARIKVAMATPRDDGSGLVPHYRFPVNDQDRYGVVAPMTPTVEAVRLRLEALTGEHLNHAVVLLYRDGNDSIGFHKDKTLDLDPEAPIVSVTLGAARPLLLRDDIFQPTVQHQVRFEAGAVFVLGPRTNREMYHAIPRVEDGGYVGPRVSLTFRRARTFKDAAGRIVGQGAEFQTANWPVALKGAHRFDDALDRAPSA